MTQQRGIWPSPTLPHMTNLARKWVRSGVTFGAAGLLAITFFTDWRDVLINVPVLNYKFVKKEE